MAVTLAWQMRAKDLHTYSVHGLKASKSRLLFLAADLGSIGWPRAGLSILETVAQIDAELQRRGVVVVPHKVRILGSGAKPSLSFGHQIKPRQPRNVRHA